jgi:hypothetical protein
MLNQNWQNYQPAQPQLASSSFLPFKAALIIAAAQPTPLSTAIASTGQFN